MFSISIKTLVNSLVRQELQDKGREKEALHFHFRLELSHYTNTATYSESRGLHLLYHVKPRFSYITVFSAVHSSSFIKVKEVEQWRHEITHDSCWANIQVFSEVYFDMAEKVNAKLKEADLETPAPKDMNEHNSFGLFGPVFDWVPVKISKDPDDERNYLKLVKVL